jgi:hypothetical protein
MALQDRLMMPHYVRWGRGTQCRPTVSGVPCFSAAGRYHMKLSTLELLHLDTTLSLGHNFLIQTVNSSDSTS